MIVLVIQENHLIRMTEKLIQIHSKARQANKIARNHNKLRNCLPHKTQILKKIKLMLTSKIKIKTMLTQAMVEMTLILMVTNVSEL